MSQPTVLDTLLTAVSLRPHQPWVTMMTLPAHAARPESQGFSALPEVRLPDPILALIASGALGPEAIQEALPACALGREWERSRALVALGARPWMSSQGGQDRWRNPSWSAFQVHLHYRGYLYASNKSTQELDDLLIEWCQPPHGPSRQDQVAWRDSDGLSLLHWAVHAGCDALVEYWCAQGLDVNALDHKGRTPLYGARRAAIVEKLLAAGATLMIEDQTGQTPINAWPAELREDKKIQTLFRSARSVTPDDRGLRTARDLLREGDMMSARKLIEHHPQGWLSEIDGESMVEELLAFAAEQAPKGRSYQPQWGPLKALSRQSLPSPVPTLLWWSAHTLAGLNNDLSLTSSAALGKYDKIWAKGDAQQMWGEIQPAWQRLCERWGAPDTPMHGRTSLVRLGVSAWRLFKDKGIAPQQWVPMMDKAMQGMGLALNTDYGLNLARSRDWTELMKTAASIPDVWSPAALMGFAIVELHYARTWNQFHPKTHKWIVDAMLGHPQAPAWWAEHGAGVQKLWDKLLPREECPWPMHPVDVMEMGMSATAAGPSRPRARI